MRRLLAAASLILACIAAIPDSRADCVYDFATKTFIGDCSGASGIGDAQDCDQSAAQIAVDWVFTDVGATRTFQKFLSEGNSPLDAVIGAQGHNPDAQGAIRNCTGWTANYIATQYGGTVDGLADNGAGDAGQACSAAAIGACQGCAISCLEGFEAYCETGQSEETWCPRRPTCVCRRR